MILLDRDTLNGKRFSEFRPFDPDVSDIIARDHEFHRTADDKFGIDVWEAQPGQLAFADLGYDEMIYVLEGNPKIRVGDEIYNGEKGDFFTLPSLIKHSIENPFDSGCLLLIGAIRNALEADLTVKELG